MLPSRLVVVGVCACHAVPFGAWSAAIGGTRDAECAGEGVAVSPSGETAMVWHVEGVGHVLALSRYDARGRIAWTHELTRAGVPSTPTSAAASGSTATVAWSSRSRRGRGDRRA